MIRSCSIGISANCNFSPRTMDLEVRNGERDSTGSQAFSSMGVVDESKEVRDSERDGMGSEASMGVVNESKEVRDGERDGTGSDASMGVVGVDEHKDKLERVLKKMEPLPGMISDLLRQQQHGGRRLTAAVDRTLRSWQFIELELRSLITSLRELEVRLSDLGSNFSYRDDGMLHWLQEEYDVAKIIRDQLHGTDQPSLRGYQARLHRAAARCFCRDAVPSLFYAGYMSQLILTRLYEAAELPCRYKHLMLAVAGDGERTSSACSSAEQPHPYSAHAAGAGASIVGIEGSLRSKQLRWFMAASQEADNKTLKVMAMVGPTGVGKTTVAMEVHRQLQQIEGRHRFQHCATAKVSQCPDIKELLKNILSQIEDKPAAHEPDTSNQTSQVTTPEEAGHEMFARKIKQCLQEKRYLVTIRDIWKKTDWDIIKNAFPENNLDSRIMITTQLRSVAQHCCSHSADGLVHEVTPLGALDSKRLLIKKAFDPEDSCPPEYLEVCDEILRRCEGIPLFIIGMAGWLHEQFQKAQGSNKKSKTRKKSKAKAKDKRELHHISTNYSMETVPKLLKQFEQALSTIYDDLSYDQKVMLMYMSVFTEGYIFDEDTLIEKWIGQGMINCYYSQGRTEQIAREFFSEVIDRNVVTRVAASSGHNLHVEEAYHWHVGYFMLQFLASKSAQFLASGSADDRGFVCTLDSIEAEGSSTVLRRLSLHQPRPEPLTLPQRLDLSCTRLLSVSGVVSPIPLDKFSHLVVLDLEGWQCFKDDDMVSVCKMYLLRYLSLRNVRGVSKLPPKIKELQHLMSLDISQTSICELPSQLCELEWLKRLDLRSTKVSQLPQQFWKKLQKLECLLVGGDGVADNETVITEISEEIKRLEKLKILAVVDLTRCSPSLVDALGVLSPVEIAITWSFHQCTDGRFQEALRSCARKWDRLESLTIHCGLGCRMDFLDFPPGDIFGFYRFGKFKMIDGRFASVPKWLSGLRYLTFIEITVCALLPGDLGILGTSQTLECLVLGLDFIPEAELIIGAEQHRVPFRHDEYVSFCGLRRLSVICRVPWLTFTQGAMPELTFLELKIAGSPASQESIPSGITNLRRLSDVAIRFHKNYINSPGVKMTVEAVKNEIAKHRMPINLFINDIEDQAEDLQAAEEGLPSASGHKSEIQNEENSIGYQEEDVQAVEEGPASEIEEEE